MATIDSAGGLIPFGLLMDTAVPWHDSMGKPFDPVDFASRIQSGALDGQLHEELARLSREQLEQVATLLSEDGERQEA